MIIESVAELIRSGRVKFASGPFVGRGREGRFFISLSFILLSSPGKPMIVTPTYPTEGEFEPSG